MAFDINSPTIRTRKDEQGNLRKTSHQEPYEITGTKISNAKEAAIAYIKDLKLELP